MSIDQHVEVTLLVSNSGTSKPTRKPLILSHNASWSDRIRYYGTSGAVTADGFAADSPEALAAARMFAQEPHPAEIAIGRAASLVTQRYKLSVQDGVVVVGHVYSARIQGEGVTDTTVSYTAQDGDDQDDVMDALKALIDAVVGANFATSGPTSHILGITGTAPGDWFSVGVTPRSGLKLVQDHDAPSGTTLADDLNAIDAETPEGEDWYWVTSLYNSAAYMKDVADWCEANGRVYIGASCDTDTANVSTGDTPTDAAFEILGDGDKRTIVIYHPRPAAFADAGATARVAPLAGRLWTAAYVNIVGVEPVSLTDNQATNILDRRASYYKREAGRSFLWDGKVGNTDNGYLDFTVNIDAFLADLQGTLLGILLSRPIGYSDPDISILTGAGKGVVARFVKSGVIAPGTPGDDNDPIPSFTFPRAGDVDAGVRATRVLPDGQCSFRYNSPVHKVLVNVTVVF